MTNCGELPRQVGHVAARNRLQFTPHRQAQRAVHTFPQSMGSSSELARSDLYHLLPAKSNVNSARGNDPSAEIPDSLRRGGII